MTSWDPAQYAQFSDQRAQPFFDLLARVRPASPPRTVVDLGCGPGELTATLQQRWPGAQVTGIDSSPDMIEKARRLPHVQFELGNLAEWTGQPDVLVSNAALQWVPEHRELLLRWAGQLPTGGWLAFQVPGNFGAPSHVLMRELADSFRWAAQLGGVLRDALQVSEPVDYARLLHAQGLQTEAWETTYLHALGGEDPVLEWVRGTGLRPVLDRLDASDRQEFESEYRQRLRLAYPREGVLTWFPFRRIFCVGHKPG